MIRAVKNYSLKCLLDCTLLLHVGDVFNIGIVFDVDGIVNCFHFMESMSAVKNSSK